MDGDAQGWRMHRKDAILERHGTLLCQGWGALRAPHHPDNPTAFSVQLSSRSSGWRWQRTGRQQQAGRQQSCVPPSVGWNVAAWMPVVSCRSCAARCRGRGEHNRGIPSQAA